MSSKPTKPTNSTTKTVSTPVSKPVSKPYQCVRCGFKADTAPRMQVHIDRKTPCKVSETGINVDLTQYRQQISGSYFRNYVEMYILQ